MTSLFFTLNICFIISLGLMGIALCYSLHRKHKAVVSQLKNEIECIAIDHRLAISALKREELQARQKLHNDYTLEKNAYMQAATSNTDKYKQQCEDLRTDFYAVLNTWHRPENTPLEDMKL